MSRSRENIFLPLQYYSQGSEPVASTAAQQTLASLGFIASLINSNSPPAGGAEFVKALRQCVTLLTLRVCGAENPSFFDAAC